MVPIFKLTALLFWVTRCAAFVARSSNVMRTITESPAIRSISRSVIRMNVESTNSNLGHLSRPQRAAVILYKLSRPHTIKGTILASVMAVIRALIESPTRLSYKLIPRALIGLVALLCGNTYIVGINQIYDVNVDEINKPFLPIAAKLLSAARAWQVITACLITGLVVVNRLFSPQIFALYCLGLVLGTVYSVPPLQLKRFPLFAGSIIAIVRGFLLNFGVYTAVREALGVSFKWNPVVVFISSFMTLFASVIAVTKDLSDIEGDRKYNITTLASQYGVKKIADAASAVLAAAYVFAIFVPLTIPGAFNALPMSLGHGAYLLYFLLSYQKLQPGDMSSVKAFYKSIWNLFYLEYCLYPFI